MTSGQTDENALAVILSPVSVTEFFDHYWEKQPLHISRTAPGQFSDLLSISAIDHCLSAQTTYFPGVQLTQSGKPIGADDYTADGREILPLRLLEFYAAGATIVISQAQLLLPALGDFCRNVQAALEMRCQTNTYLSPPGNQGFNPHYDTHDVFILQVSGTKTFHFYSAGAELPLTTDQYDPALKEGAEKTGEVTLQPGDTLYIPRGLVHDAIAQNKEPSLHITLGLYPLVYADVLQALVQVASEQDSQYRRSVPRVLYTPTNTQLMGAVTTLLEQAITQDNLQQALSRLLDEFSMQSRQDSGGVLTRLHASGNIQLQSQIGILKQRVLTTSLADNYLKVRSFGQILEFAAPMSDAFAWLYEQGQCRVAEIPLEHDEQKLAFCQQLLNASLIELVGLDDG